MRKSLIIGGLVFAFAAAGLIGIIINVSARAEDVHLTEEILVGDKAYAEDISFQINSQWEEKLSWETLVDIGEETKVDTEFTFYPDGMNIQYDSEHTVSLEYSTGFGYGSSAHLLGEDGPVDLPYKEIFEDVATRTKNGEERTEVVKLADYYDYFELELNVSDDRYLARYITSDFEAGKFITEGIGMRIPEDLEFEATLTKQEDGSVNDVSGNLGPEDFRILSGGVVLRNGCYVYVSVVDDKGVVPGLSEHGYGIYKLPFTWAKEATSNLYWKEGEEIASVHFDQFAPVYPCEDNMIALTSNVEETELFLLVSRDGELVLQRIDCESFAMLQELALGTLDEAIACTDLKVTDEGILLLMSNGMVYYAENMGESYKITVSCDMFRYDFYEKYYNADYEVYAYDYEDGRLAVIWKDTNDYASNSVYVFVLEGEECKFLAHYKNSLDQADRHYRYSNILHPAEPVEISIE